MYTCVLRNSNFLIGMCIVSTFKELIYIIVFCNPFSWIKWILRFMMYQWN